jgi:hyperosmotically inducible periplasmic protein
MNTPSNRNNSYRHALIAAAMAAGLGAGTAGAAAADSSAPRAHSDSMGAAVTDTAITAEVKVKLLGETGLKRSHITVTTTNGAVTLEGSASSAHAKAVAEAASKSVAGVKSVDDQLALPARTQATVKKSEMVAATERAVSDSWITTEVKSEILADSVTNGFAVSVDTVHGVVILKGALANQDAVTDVKHIAAKVSGVERVDTSALTVAEK